MIGRLIDRPPAGRSRSSGELVLDPRLNIHQQLSESLTLRQSIGRYHQPPTPGDVDPEHGNPHLDSSYFDQISLGVDAKLPGEVFASLTGFFNYGTQIGVKVRDQQPGGETPEPNLGGLGPTLELLLEKQLGFAIYRENVGRARSAGLELLLKRSVGSWFGMVAYTLAISERVDDPRTGMGWRPFELDQRHNLNLAVSKLFTSWRLGYHGGVREWCINTAGIDVPGQSAIVNCEDGKAYRWHFPTNTLSETVTLTIGIGEAYTPTIIGANGVCYAINDARLYALGR